VLFDVDGTLYDQRPVRRSMSVRLVRSHALAPRRGLRTMRALRAYRRAQEAMRSTGFEGDVEVEQVRRAASSANAQDAAVTALVTRWMEEEPLGVVAASARPALRELLDALAAREIRLAVVSDYPADRKLAALGVADRFDVVLSAQDPRVHAFKPNPKGLLVALDELGVAPADAVYVGDRIEVDGAAAHAAGMAFVLVGDGPSRRLDVDDHTPREVS
jgi:HAD superfamily hydrolase (TIGR01509 family)